MIPQHPHRLAWFAAALLSFVPVGWSQGSGDEAFQRAYYLHHEKGALQEALVIYRQVAADKGADVALRAKAEEYAATVVEDLAADDLARLMPPAPLLFAACHRPGEKVKSLLDQLGLLQTAQQAGQERFGVSPHLVEGLLGVRGLAVSVTAIDWSGGPPEGVAVLHAGDLDLILGLIETALPFSGRSVEPIGGHATWVFEDQLFVTRTHRLLIASGERAEIEGVLARLRGDSLESLATSGVLDEALPVRDGLFSFCARAEPIMPMLEGLLQAQAQDDPEAAMALAFLDVGSLRSLSGHLDVDEQGLSIELLLRLAEGHRNLAFNLLRMPHVDRGTLELVPEGAAFFVAGALNPRGPAPAGIADEHGQPVVTAMDFGRELFGNLVDVALYGIPSGGSSDSPGLPEIAAVLRSNDPARSHALWSLLLSGASQFAHTETVDVGGVAVRPFEIEGMPIYLASHGERVILSTSIDALRGALRTKKGQASVVSDAFYAKAIAGMPQASSLVAMANPGRLLQLAAAMEHGGAADEMRQVAQLLSGTLLAVGLEQSSTRLALRARVRDLPDVSPLIGHLMQQQRDHAKARPASSRGGKDDLSALVAGFEHAARDSGKRDEALALGQAILHAADANGLNNLAWKLLTEDRFQRRFDELALQLSQRCNEETGYESWAFVDTLALANFHNGRVDEAIQLQERALELAGDDERADAARQTLKRFRAAKAEVH